MSDFLSKADYEEARCPLNMHPEVNPIPVGRVMEKLDSHLNRKDYSGAELHLRYWLVEAEAGHDMRGKLTLLNEQIGLFRKTEKEAECLKAAADALALAEAMNMEESVTYGTTLINAATGYKAFGRATEAFTLYCKAQPIYEKFLKPDDGRLGGLYNNMALTLTELKEYRGAEELYRKAIGIMERQENGAPEVAITYLNLADMTAAEKGMENGEAEIEEYLMKAEEQLNTEGLTKDGYYAFVCEKCAPVFGYYGYFLVEKELRRRAKEIYERT